MHPSDAPRLWRTSLPAALAAIVLAACGTATTVSPTGSSAPSAPASVADSSMGPTPIALPAPEVTSIQIGLSTLEANGFVAKLAEDLGLYEKYGITSVEVSFFEGAQRNMQAIIADQIEVASDAPQTTLTSMTTDEPLQDVAVYANGFLDCIVTTDAIATGEDLVGQRVAVSSLGGQSHAEVLVTLEALGLAESDVNIVQVGGQSARVAALEAGSVDAIPVDCVTADNLADSGFNILLRLPEVGIDFPTSNLSMKRSFIEENPNTVLAIVAANLEAMQVLFEDEDSAVESLVGWAQIEEEEARGAIQAFKDIATRSLVPTDEGYQTVQEILAITNPEVADVDASQAYTTQFLDQLREMGLYDELGVPAS